MRIPLVNSLLLMMALYSTQNAHGQQANRAALENDISSWITVSALFPLIRRWQLYFEVQPRWQKLHPSHFSENIIRTGIGYRFNRSWSLFNGYYWSAHYDPEYSPEHRI